METYVTVQDILRMAADFHRRLGEYDEQLSRKVEREPVAQLLRYLAGEEKRLQEGLNQFGEEAGEEIRRARIQYASGPPELKGPEARWSPDMDVDDVVDFTVVFHNRLLRLYEEGAENPTAPKRVREMFRKLAEQAGQERAKMSRAAQQIA